jgi:hypothetical protein
MTTETIQLKLSVFELAEKLTKGESIKLNPAETITLTGIDMQDFFAIVNEEELAKKANVLQQIMNRFNIALMLEGAVGLGAMNLDERSWTLAASNETALKISARPLPFKLSINELVNFLKKLPVGQGLVFRSQQDLVLTGFSEKGLMNYYEFSQGTQDPKVLEKAQDQFFFEASEALQKEGLVLKMFGLEAAQLNREVNPAFGMIAFRAQGNETLTQPRIVVALTKKA